MNYWLGLGLLVFAVGVIFFWIGRGASRRIKRDGVLEGNSVGVVGLGYALPLLGALFVLIGIVQVLS